MLESRYLQLDVFAGSFGGGNPLGVVVDGQGWSPEQMQAFARWTNLVETTFLLPPTNPDASYRVRIFTPHKEIPFAGHPSVGSAHAALECCIAVANDDLLIQECAAGLLGIRVRGDGDAREVSVQSPDARVLETGIDAHPLLREVLDGISLGKLAPAFVEGGRRWWVAEFADEAQLRAWRPENGQIAALAKNSDSLGLCAFARSDDEKFDLVVRAFPAGVGIVEDPASGAANGLIAAYIAQAEPDGQLAQGYKVSQGREMGHDALILVEIRHDGIWVGGRTNTVISGTVNWR